MLQNTEGDPLVLCEVTLRTDDPAALAAELDETYERDGDTWREHITGDGIERIRATLRLDGDDLIVIANSEPRADCVLAIVRTLDPRLCSPTTRSCATSPPWTDLTCSSVCSAAVAGGLRR